MAEHVLDLNDTLIEIEIAKSKEIYSGYKSSPTMALLDAGLSIAEIATVSAQDCEYLDIYNKKNYDSNQLIDMGYNICGMKNSLYEALTNNQRLVVKTNELKVLNDKKDIYTFTSVLALIARLDNSLTFIQAVETRARELKKMTLDSIAIVNLLEKLKTVS